ncbi:MAG: tryptophan synthase subunit alpha [Kiritimatiellae bacterium]|nr:tryptophan synthase subunit alpha [Kiritimatiellia bacterium]
MNRIDQVFEACRKSGRTVLIPFITAGDPSLEVTERVILELVRNGADIIELGVPFSDPMADGPTIQEACERALQSGTRLKDILLLVARLRGQGVQTPFVLFSYFNMIHHYGVEKLARDCQGVGMDAWLTVDVPVEEVGEIKPSLDAHGLHWIALVAPTTPEDRLEKILKQAGGFIYYITVTGVTGARTTLPTDVAQHLRLIRGHTDIPVAAGFGISSADMVRGLRGQADAVVVGSKIIKTLQGESTIDAGIHAVGHLVKSLSDACEG